MAVGRFEVGLIGANIQRSLSPTLHETEAAAAGLDYRYTLFDLDRMGGVDALPDVLGRLRADGFAGTNVTFPVKQAVIPLLDRLSDEAEAMGAVNTVRFAADGTAEGHNTDWWGFGENLRRGLGDAPLGRVLLLGAGGAGAAAGYALGAMGATAILIADADAEKAAGLAERLAGQGFPATGVAMAAAATALETVDGLVNATPMGMARYPGSPIDTGRLRPEHWVAEIVYTPLETALLAAARAIGCRTVDGGGMVVLQAARAMEIFTGTRPDIDRMLGHFARVSAA